ncbi:hypothetical protein [Lentzea sp. NPDC055074]
MCRAGGRRCIGGSSRSTQATRQQRSRAKRALREARAGGDPDAIRTATERLDAANEAHQAAKENAMSHHDHDNTAAQSGDVTPPKPGPVTGALSDTPLLDNTWGSILDNSPIHYHDDGPIGTAVKYMGQDATMDVDGEPLANVVGKLATDVVRRKTTAQQAVNDLKELRDRLPEGSRAHQCLSTAVRNMDGPDTPVPQVPAGTPEPLRELVGKLHAVPIVRQEPQREMEPLLKLCEQAAAGNARFLDEEVKRLRNKRHESLGDCGKFEIQDAVDEARKAMREQEQQQRKPRAATAASSKPAGQSGDVTKQSAHELIREMREDMKQREQAARDSGTNSGPQAATNVTTGPSIVGIQGSIVTGNTRVISGHVPPIPTDQSGDVTSTRNDGDHSGQWTHVNITNNATNVGIQGQTISGATIVNGRIVNPGTSTAGGDTASTGDQLS